MTRHDQRENRIRSTNNWTDVVEMTTSLAFAQNYGHRANLLHLRAQCEQWTQETCSDSITTTRRNPVSGEGEVHIANFAHAGVLAGLNPVDMCLVSMTTACVCPRRAHMKRELQRANS